MSKRKKKLPVAIIEWDDHTSNDAWLDAEGVKKEGLAVITSIGWLVREDKDKYVIAGGIEKDTASYTNVQTIGKGMVKRIRVGGKWR
jgi:hypothetical protein